MVDADGRRMIDSQHRQIAKSRPRRRSTRVVVGGFAALLAVTVAFVTVALAVGTAATVGSASNSKLGERVLVSAQGRTLYALSPETAHHLLCTSGECLKFWPPLAVPSDRKSTRLNS